MASPWRPQYLFETYFIIKQEKNANNVIIKDIKIMLSRHQGSDGPNNFNTQDLYLDASTQRYNKELYLQFEKIYLFYDVSSFLSIRIIK